MLDQSTDMSVERREANHSLGFNVLHVDRQLSLHRDHLSAQVNCLSNSNKHDLDFQIFAATP